MRDWLTVVVAAVGLGGYALVLAVLAVLLCRGM